MSNAGKTRAQVIGHASCPVPAEKSQKSLDAVFEEVYYSQAGDFRGWDAHVRCRRIDDTIVPRSVDSDDRA
jgi:hypothetical protein